MAMARSQAIRSWYSVEQWLLGSIALAALTLVSISLSGRVPSALADFVFVALLVAVLLAALIMTRLVGIRRRQLAVALQSRAAAERAEMDLRLTVDAIPALVWSATADGSRDFHSRRWLEFTGLSAAQAEGKGWVAALHPQDHAVAAERWRASVATGKPFEVEVRGRNADGEYRWFLVRAEPKRDEKGAIVKWYGSNTDIEDRKRAIEQLRESEAQWKEVFEHNPVMYFMVDAAGVVLSVNSFGAGQLGYSVDELLGQSVLKVFQKVDRPLVEQNVAVCLADIGRTHSWEIRKVRKDGSVLWVRENAKAVRRLDGRLIVLIACEDITERRQTEHALRQSGTFLAEAERLSHTGSFGWNTATGETVWSDETFRIFGYQKTAFVHVDMVVERTHPEDRAQVLQVIARALGEGKDFDHAYRLRMPDGSIKYVHAMAHAAEVMPGGVKFVGAVTDVTARRLAEDQLHEAQANLAHVTRVTALGELTVSIAHEVNQPLAAVVTNAEACLRWLDRDPPDLDEARNAVRSIIKDGNRAGEVIQRVRSFVNKGPARKTSLRINEVVSEVITLVQHELMRHRISLEMELASDLPAVRADRIQLQQVILNLVLNGIEAMQSLKSRPRELAIRTRRGGADRILVTVKDCGTGIAVENADRLFDAFFTTKSNGMGMGLSICRSIIEAHGGRLSICDDEGPGATFEFSLPLGHTDGAP